MKTFKKLGKIAGLTLAIIFSLQMLISAPDKIATIIFLIIVWLIVTFTIKIWVPFTYWINDTNKGFFQYLLEHKEQQNLAKQQKQPTKTEKPLTPEETNTFNQIINQLNNDNPDRNNL